MVSAEQAKKGVGEFLTIIGRDAGFDRGRIEGLLGAAVSKESPNVGPMWSFESPFGSFWVSQRSGEVVRYAVNEAEPGPVDDLSPEVAEAEAVRFIRTVYKDFDRRNFKLGSRDADETGIEFEFEELPRESETSIFSNFIRVVVSPPGKVTRYSCSNLPFKRTTPQRISEVEARRIVTGIVGARNGVIEQLQLVEEPVDGASRSITVWSAFVLYRIDGDEEMERIVINADTGERVVLE